jgi:LacI family transcriptional regulator
MATIRDVALKAGVSIATVSYVINASRRVSQQSKDKVLRAVKDLRFTPSKNAKSLRRGLTHTLGLVMGELTNRFASHFIKGLENTASEHRYSIIVSDLQEKKANEEQCLMMLLEQNVDGIIYDGYGQVESELVQLYRDGLPVIIVDKPLTTKILPSILIDNERSVYKALRYLKSLGHRQIVFLNGLKMSKISQLRAKAFRDFMTRNRLPFEENRIVFGDFKLEHGHDATLKMLKKGVSFSAIFCGDDMIAFGAIAALRSQGILVPDDIAVVGFDDDPISAVFEPSLTTIHYPMVEMGRLSFQLFERISAGRPRRADHIIMKTELVVRRSSGKGIGGVSQMGHDCPACL